MYGIVNLPSIATEDHEPLWGRQPCGNIGRNVTSEPCKKRSEGATKGKHIGSTLGLQLPPTTFRIGEALPRRDNETYAAQLIVAAVPQEELASDGALVERAQQSLSKGS